MIPIGDSQEEKNVPVVTYSLVALSVLIFLWDRQMHFGGAGVIFADLGMRPSDVMAALSDASNDRVALMTVFTSLFLHGNLFHLLGNVLFLFIFGPAVEDALGSPRFALYYLFWGVVASAAHVFVNPASQVPVIGASGAIGGVLGCYFLLFPASKIEYIVPFIPIPFVASAWILLGMWFLFQIFFPQEGVANWAHAGGFMAGMATVLIMGGRKAVLKGRDSDWEVEHG